MFIQRDIVKNITNALNRKEIVAIVGARQIGKTTIMNYFYNKVKTNKSNFITFDDLDILNLFENNINLFIEKYVESNDFLFIDEIQYSKNSGKYLKLIYDKYKIKIFISGSSRSEVAIHSLQYLVGRVFIFECYPLSFKNFIDFFSKENSFLFSSMRKFEDFNILKKEFSEYLKFGGYPEVVLDRGKGIKREILRNIKNTYLLKEIRGVLNYRDLSEFENMLRKLALQDGKILNKSSVAQDLGIHNNKIREIIDVLEKTTILNIVRPYLSNKSKELIKSPKTYLFDLGFKNSIINNFNDVDLKQDKGEVYENFILNSFVKAGLNVNFWNYKSSHEMDFVIEGEKGVFGFEIKSRIGNAEISSSMKKFIDLNKVKRIYVFCENSDVKKKYNGCEVIFTHYLNVFWIINKVLC
ncbi:ATP-binding protein [Candidatus Pacearchaeota archaeon]|nr:ATP-binding protein [Candidatus Pacearchaeota archaeon]